MATIIRNLEAGSSSASSFLPWSTAAAVGAAEAAAAAIEREREGLGCWKGREGGSAFVERRKGT